MNYYVIHCPKSKVRFLSMDGNATVKTFYGTKMFVTIYSSRRRKYFVTLESPPTHSKKCTGRARTQRVWAGVQSVINFATETVVNQREKVNTINSLRKSWQDTKPKNFFFACKQKSGGKHLLQLRQCFLHHGGNLHLRNISSGLGKHLFPYNQTYLFTILLLITESCPN